MLVPAAASLLLTLCASASYDRRQTETLTLSVMRETSEIETSLGMVREECLILLDEGGTRYCRVLVNDEVLDSGMGGSSAVPSERIDALPTSVESVSTIPSASFSDGQSPSSAGPTSLLISQSSDPDPATSATSQSGSSANPEATSSPAASVEVVAESTSASTSGASDTSAPSSSIESDQKSSSSAIEPASSPPPPSTDSNIPASSASAIDPSASSASPTASTSGVITITRSASNSTLPSGSPSLLNPEASSTSSSAAAADSDTTAEAAEADSAAQEIPGQKLQVLPIGIGVFGGLAAITLAVVGYVMYERRKYRKQFRGRKLAEAGASPAGWVR